MSVLGIMEKKEFILLASIVVIIMIAGFFVVKEAQNAVIDNQSLVIIKNQDSRSNNKQPTTPNQTIQNKQQKISKQTVDPISDALLRITKKPFGIFITKKTSPVQPERFAGYHTGADLEINPDELNAVVAVKALCDGKLLSARSASGYGGVAAASCTLDGQEVTVVYGHINLSTLAIKIGDSLKAGDFLANLGDAYSAQTDGERKHLHLAIHKGSGVNILGYVPSKSEFSNWLDPEKYL